MVGDTVIERKTSLSKARLLIAPGFSISSYSSKKGDEKNRTNVSLGSILPLYVCGKPWESPGFDVL